MDKPNLAVRETTSEPNAVRAQAADHFIVCRMARLTKATISGTLTEVNRQQKFKA